MEKTNALLENVDLVEVSKLSEGAAIFYSWCMVTMEARKA